jgi:hypothetical protein
MTEPPRRDEVIELLKRLGSDRDEDVLEAAREVHARITAAGMTWEDLLVSEGGDAESDDESDDDIDDTDDDIDDDDESNDDDDDDESDDDTDDDAEAPDPEDAITRPAGATGAKDADSIALIDKLLAKSDISTDLREELEGYKTDIAAGEFEDRDRRYLGAVYKRLSKRR